jgi:protein AroM
MTVRIGFATVGESPRDDVIPRVASSLPPGTEVVQRGCLDGLTRAQMQTFFTLPGDDAIVARVADGGSVLLAFDKLFPRMQEVVDGLVRCDGAELVVVLCGADWTGIASDVLFVNPGRLFPAVVCALGHGRRLGIIKPDAGQIAAEREHYGRLGIEAHVTAASPYPSRERISLAEQAAVELSRAGCEMVWMSCVGMDWQMRKAVQDIVKVPVILASSVLGRVVAELVAVEGCQPYPASEVPGLSWTDMR